MLTITQRKQKIAKDHKRKKQKAHKPVSKPMQRNGS